MRIKKITFNQLIDRLIWILTLLYLFLVCVLTTDTWGSVVMFGCSGVIFVLSSIKAHGKIKIILSYYHVWWFVFAIFELSSALWAMSPQSAITQAATTIKLLICMALMYIYYQEENDLWRLYNVIRWSGVAVAIYTVFYLGIDLLMKVIFAGNRMEVDFANINTIGILASFSVVITLYELLFRKSNLFSSLTLVPCILIIAASGTRKALLAILIGGCILLYYRVKTKNVLKTALRVLIVGSVTFILLTSILSLPMFSGLMGRMAGLMALLGGEGKVDNSALVRNQMIHLGLEKFFEMPLFGIGIGSSSQYLSQTFVGKSSYLHNNYVELLCCGGIVGFVIYYSMFVYLLWTFYKHRNDSDNTVKLGLSMVIIYLAMDMARVSYYSKPTFFYTMIFYLQVKSLNSTTERNRL